MVVGGIESLAAFSASLQYGMRFLSSGRVVHSTLQSNETNSTPGVGFRGMSWVARLGRIWINIF